MTDINPLANGSFQVHCAQHKFTRVVGTAAHATNLAGVHDRVDHAEDHQEHTLDLTSAAREVVEWADGYHDRGAGAALEVWAALTQKPEAEALAYARQIADAGDPLTAVLPPF